MKKTLVLSLALATTVLGSSLAVANDLSVKSFFRETELSPSPETIQRTWSQLKTMGTDEFLGGTIGGFKLDESSMIAGALTVGSTEFDNFLRSGKLNSSDSGMGKTLSDMMSKGAGFDLSSYINSYTPNGGKINQQASVDLSRSSGAVNAGTCSPEVAQGLVDQANKHIENVVSIASSSDYGFSSIADITGGMTGFAGMGCLDKLFQNLNMDILFKPPSLGNLTNKLQNWTCNQAIPIAEQIAGAFSEGDFQTSDYGGFFPAVTMSDAQQGNPLSNPRASIESVFGKKFASFNGIKENVSLNSLFK